jgi:hypothetical protein
MRPPSVLGRLLGRHSPGAFSSRFRLPFISSGLVNGSLTRAFGWRSGLRAANLYLLTSGNYPYRSRTERPAYRRAGFKRSCGTVAATRAELRAVDAEIERLSTAIAEGGPLEALLQAVRQREARPTALRATLDAGEALGRAAPFNRVATRRRLERHLAAWRELLRRNVTSSRQILRKVLEGPIVCTPLEGRTGVRFEADAAVGPMIAGVLELPHFEASPPGIGPDRNTLLQEISGGLGPPEPDRQPVWRYPAGLAGTAVRCGPPTANCRHRR